MDKIFHIPVLKDETISFFKDLKDGYIIDATCGFGGHSEAILNINKSVKLICNDQDDDALNFAKKRLNDFKDRVIFSKGNFKDVIQKYKDYDIKGVLADIGVSSYQIDTNDRGFKFLSDKLDMRMDKDSLISAFNVVNEYPIDKLEYIFKNYGEIKNYKFVANEIIKNRVIDSAKKLSAIFNYPKNQKLIRLLFQAIRIEVNQELEVLKKILDDIEKYLNNTIIAIISFHSLEDRIVKDRFKKWSTNCICDKNSIKCECGNNNSIGKILTKKPIVASSDEIKQNSRSKSAKLRVFKIEK